MKRVMIIGQPGSGKSTLARQLGPLTGLPVVHIDLIHYQPGWVERSQFEKTRLCREVHARAEWIFEGGHSKTWPERLERSDTLIWLDYPLWRRVWRVFTRTLKDHGKSRPDMPEGCPERFDPEFYRFIWQTRNSSRQTILHLIKNAAPGKMIIKLSNRYEVQAFLNSFEAPPAATHS